MPSSFIEDTRGAAMVEGVIVFPLFIIVFAAVLYYHQAYSVKLERNNKARSCAWTYSVSGCKEIPDGCPISEIGEAKLASIDDGVDARGGIFGNSGSAAPSQELSGVQKAVGTGNSMLLALAGLDEGIVATPARDIEMPSLLGGATRSISGNYSVMCNEVSITPRQLLLENYCQISSDLPGCP